MRDVATGRSVFIVGVLLERRTVLVLEPSKRVKGVGMKEERGCGEGGIVEGGVGFVAVIMVVSDEVGLAESVEALPLFRLQRPYDPNHITRYPHWFVVVRG